jgi:hypothetical protein
MAWLFEFGHSMYAALQRDYVSPCENHDCQLWRFDGPTASARLLNSNFAADDQPVGNGQVGLLIAQPATSRSDPKTFEAIHVDVTTGATTSLGGFRTTLSNYILSSEYLSGAMYVLMEGELFRIGL